MSRAVLLACRAAQVLVLAHGVIGTREALSDPFLPPSSSASAATPAPPLAAPAAFASIGAYRRASSKEVAQADADALACVLQVAELAQLCLAAVATVPPAAAPSAPAGGSDCSDPQQQRYQRQQQQHRAAQHVNGLLVGRGRLLLLLARACGHVSSRVPPAQQVRGLALEVLFSTPADGRAAKRLELRKHRNLSQVRLLRCLSGTLRALSRWWAPQQIEPDDLAEVALGGRLLLARLFALAPTPRAPPPAPPALAPKPPSCRPPAHAKASSPTAPPAAQQANGAATPPLASLAAPQRHQGTTGGATVAVSPAATPPALTPRSVPPAAAAHGASTMAAAAAATLQALSLAPTPPSSPAARLAGYRSAPLPSQGSSSSSSSSSSCAPAYAKRSPTSRAPNDEPPAVPVEDRDASWTAEVRAVCWARVRAACINGTGHRPRHAADQQRGRSLVHRTGASRVP